MVLTGCRARGGRLALVAGVAALLTATGLVGFPRTSAALDETPAELLARAAASQDVPHTGTAVSFGSLGLPDLPRLGRLTALLGSTTRTRVQWAGPAEHRVDELLATGERSTYVDGDAVTVWDYGKGELRRGETVRGARLPRPEDLLPPSLLRGLVAGTGAEEMVAAAEPLGGARVAGRPASGLRIASGDPRGTLAHADVWVDDESGMATEVTLVDRAGVTALLSRFDHLRLEPPDPAALVPPAAPGAERRDTRDDLATIADDFAPYDLPDTLAGYPGLRAPIDDADGRDDPYRRWGALEDGASPGVAVYGSGLTRLAVLPLPGDVGKRAVDVARTSGGIDLDTGGAVEAAGGEAVLLAAGAVRMVMVRVPVGRFDRSYVVAGDVDPRVLGDAVTQLVDDPPPWQRGRR